MQHAPRGPERTFDGPLRPLREARGSRLAPRMMEDTGATSRPVPACTRSRPGPVRESAESVLHATRNCCFTFPGRIRCQRVALPPRLRVAVTRPFEGRFSRELAIPKALDELYACSAIASREATPRLHRRTPNCLMMHRERDRDDRLQGP